MWNQIIDGWLSLKQEKVTSSCRKADFVGYEKEFEVGSQIRSCLMTSVSCSCPQKICSVKSLEEVG